MPIQRVDQLRGAHPIAMHREIFLQYLDEFIQYFWNSWVKVMTTFPDSGPSGLEEGRGRCHLIAVVGAERMTLPVST
jgi:hypothetical protein